MQAPFNTVSLNTTLLGASKLVGKASADEANGYANATREQALIIAMRMVENLKK